VLDSWYWLRMHRPAAEVAVRLLLAAAAAATAQHQQGGEAQQRLTLFAAGWRCALSPHSSCTVPPVLPCAHHFTASTSPAPLLSPSFSHQLNHNSPQNLTRPDEDEVAKTAKETMEALNRRVTNKLAVQNPSTLPEQPGAPTYIKYTPSQQGAAYASGAKQRIIKMQDMPVDPLEPPKFRHTKVPRGTGSPPVPVMHSPPRPVTAEDQANWKIPPCISNWKNAKGYTIPLDKRLAADGRGLQVRWHIMYSVHCAC
jgi:hypothetical protein